MDPHLNQGDQENFLMRFNRNKSTLHDSNKRQVMEDILVEFSDIFAKYRIDVGYNSDITMKLTPEHNQPVYTQIPATPVHLRDELQVQLALLQYFGIITTLHHSKYSSPIFAHRKPNGELRILVDLRRKTIFQYMITTITNSRCQQWQIQQHNSQKNLFCKLDYQANHCVQMADPLLIQFLALNYA